MYPLAARVANTVLNPSSTSFVYFTSLLETISLALSPSLSLSLCFFLSCIYQTWTFITLTMSTTFSILLLLVISVPLRGFTWLSSRQLPIQFDAVPCDRHPILLASLAFPISSRGAVYFALSPCSYRVIRCRNVRRYISSIFLIKARAPANSAARFDLRPPRSRILFAAFRLAAVIELSLRASTNVSSPHCPATTVVDMTGVASSTKLLFRVSASIHTSSNMPFPEILYFPNLTLFTLTGSCFHHSHSVVLSTIYTRRHSSCRNSHDRRDRVTRIIRGSNDRSLPDKNLP